MCVCVCVCVCVYVCGVYVCAGVLVTPADQPASGCKKLGIHQNISFLVPSLLLFLKK
jgi:hypothetical protein